MANTKYCPSCKQNLLIDEFPIDKQTNGGRYGHCLACHRERQNKKYNLRKLLEPDWYRKILKRQRNNHYIKNYGITSDQFDALVKIQDNKCSMCGVVFSDSNKPCLDHNHTTGERRGIICNRCNIAVSFLEINPRIYEQARSYLNVKR